MKYSWQKVRASKWPLSVGLHFWQLLSVLPDVMEPELYPEVLYIGANKGRCLTVPELVWAGCVVDAVEIWQPYVDGLRTLNEQRHWFRDIQQGDVRKLSETVTKKYPLVMWLDGPEHVEEHELAGALDQIDAAATKLAVVTCPHGHVYQGATDGNEAQRHRWDAIPQPFLDAGWEVSTLREEPCVQSQLIAWKRKEL